MLKDDPYTFYIAWCIIEVFYLITPVSIAITVLHAIGDQHYRVPRFVEYLALIENTFYFCFYLPRRIFLESLPPAFTVRSREDRNELFHKCLDTVPDVDQWLSTWFNESNAGYLGREDVKAFLAWGFLNKNATDEVDDAELEDYLSHLEKTRGLSLNPSGTGLQPCRVSIDKMSLRHKSLTFYILVVSVADLMCHVLLSKTSLHHYRLPLRSVPHVWPLRPLTIFSRSTSPSPKISYWFRPHLSKARMPVLFLHGIGVGLGMYALFLQELVRQLDVGCEIGQVGIIALEIMPISMRLTNTIPPWEETVAHIRSILAHHKWTDFVIIAHSYGSICATHLLRGLRLSNTLTHHPLVFVDPVTLSIHLAEIPYNFIYRKPRTANELLCSFAATDIGICPAIMRCFDWTQNVLWLDEIEHVQVDVVIGGKDVIVDTKKLQNYLLRNGFENMNREAKNDSGIDLSVISGQIPTAQHRLVFHDSYNHGEVFLRRNGRKELAKLVAQRCSYTQIQMQSEIAQICNHGLIVAG